MCLFFSYSSFPLNFCALLAHDIGHLWTQVMHEDLCMDVKGDSLSSAWLYIQLVQHCSGCTRVLRIPQCCHFVALYVHIRLQYRCSLSTVRSTHNLHHVLDRTMGMGMGMGMVQVRAYLTQVYWRGTGVAYCAKVLGIQNLHARVHESTYGRPPPFIFCCRVILFSFKSCEFCNNLLVSAIFQVACHRFVCMLVYITVNPTEFELLAALQTR